VAGKTRGADVTNNRRQRPNSPSCQVIGSHTSGDTLAKLLPTSSSHEPAVIAGVRKTACVGGHSLATSPAKQLLARPACRGGRMMPDQSAKHRAAKKKQKHKRVSSKLVRDENVTDGKCVGERQKSRPHQAADAQNVASSSDEKPSASDTPSAPLPRIVIKIHQGKIVSPSAVVTPPVKKQTTERHSNGNAQQRKSPETGAQRTEKSDCDRLKSSPRPTKPVVGSKSHPKLSGQPPSSSVLADSNSNVTQFDESVLQNSGSYDKLSLDCCMKLYNQLRDQHATSQSTRSLSDAKSPRDSNSAKQHRSSVADQTARVSKSKKRSVDHTKQSSSSGLAVGANLSASRPTSCRVELNRIKSSTDIAALVGRVSAGDSSGVKTGRERSADSVCELDAGVTDDKCSVSLPRSVTERGDVSTHQVCVPSATDKVPGSSVPLSKLYQNFSKKRHATAEGDSCNLVSPKKSRSAETIRSNHCTKDNNYTSSVAKESGKPVSGRHLQSDVTESDKLHGESEMPTASIDPNVRHMKTSAIGSRVGRTPEGGSSEALISRKRCSSADRDSGSCDVVSKPSSAKRSRTRLIPDEVSVSSAVVNEEPIVSSPPLLSVEKDTIVSQLTSVQDRSSDTDLLSADVRWTPPQHSLENCPTSESGSSPLRLRIRRLADVCPVHEMYNVTGQDVDAGSTSAGTFVSSVQNVLREKCNPRLVHYADN